ncbi:MAG: hypothetical protein WC708_18235 [Lentisphaeria bacterium]
MPTPPHSAARKTHARFRALLPAMVLLVFLPVIVRGTGFSYTTAVFTVTAGNHTITLSATASSGDKSSFLDKVTAAVSN